MLRDNVFKAERFYNTVIANVISARHALVSRNTGEVGSFGLRPGSQVDLSRNGSLFGTVDGMLRGNTLNPMERVEVLVQDNLVAGGATLTGNDGGVGKEELPNLRVLVSICPSWLVILWSNLRGTNACHTWPRSSHDSQSSYDTTSREWPSSERQ